ncbi:MAG: WD40/YVTN/BNR-like repeat-containing protein, partial [Bacteroidota bacterium]
MKIKYTIIVIFITALCAAIPARAQWKEIFSYPSQFHGITFLDIYFLESDPNYGWICGFQGTVLYTTDAGQNWLGTRIPTVNQLESIYFPTPNIGYTSGEGQIHKSTDGGRTWRDITPTMAYTSGLWGNFFLDENVGMVIGGGCGSQQMFFRTTDGGATWDYFSESVLESGLCDVVLYDENGMGYASSSGLIWQTDDGGRTWRVMSVSGQRDWQEEIAHKGNTFLVPYSTSCTGGGGSGGARMSLDPGANWIDVNFGYAMFGAFLLDERRGWVVGWNATAAYTNDGGKTWENRNCGLGSRNMDDIWFVNDSIGWVVGEGVFKTMQINTLLPEIAATANSICEGDSVVLTTSREYISYRWSTGETTRSITVTEPGRYFVFVRNDSCAQGESAPIFVDVAPAPELTLELSETEPPCQGDTIYI